MDQRRAFEAWARSAAAAERAFAMSDSVAHRLETGDAARYLAQIDRVRQHVEGPVKQYAELAERVRKVAEGPAKQYFDLVERTREAIEWPVQQYWEAAGAPARRAVELAEQARMIIEGPARRMQEHHERLSRLLGGFDYGRALRHAAALGTLAEEALQASLPINWRALSLDDAEKVERLVRDEGVPLVWVPGALLTAKVAAAGSAADAMGVLLAEQDAVLADIEEVLDEVTHGDFVVLVEKARKSIAALRGGHGDAAQALAAAVFTTALHDGLGHHELRDVRREAERTSPDAASLSAYRGALVVQLASRYVQGRGYELPGFNRSTTLHRVETGQYTPANNLASVMAAAAVLREGQARRDAGPH